MKLSSSKIAFSCHHFNLSLSLVRVKMNFNPEEAIQNQLPVQSGRGQIQFVNSKPVMVPPGSLRHDLRWLNVASNWIRRVDPSEPVMPYTKYLVPDKLAAVGVIPPSDSSNSSSSRSHGFRGRIGRGGRIIFDRWNPLMHTLVGCGDSLYTSPRQQPSTRFI